MNDRATIPALEDSAFFMPFSMNRKFKKAPRLMSRASGIHYFTPEGRQLIDGTSGLWCVNAGHCRERIVKAVQKQVAELDFAPTFQMGHPLAFAFAEKLAQVAPGDLKRVFFTNSGSESVDTALKIALAYHRARGEGHRMRLIGRERGYHGVNFGGTAVGGVVGTARCSARWWRAWTTSATRTTWTGTLSRAGSPGTARNWPTTSSACARCTIPPPSPR